MAAAEGPAPGRETDTPRIRIYGAKSEFIPVSLKEKLERDARRNWDIFYKNNTNKFFKDRHYLQSEWGHYLLPKVAVGHHSGSHLHCNTVAGPSCGKAREVCSRPPEPMPGGGGRGAGGGGVVILELGCGAGNSVYPLLEQNPLAFIYACDFSARAVELVKAHPRYRDSRVCPFVCDLTRDDLAAAVPAASVDVATAVFVLSAVSPDRMRAVIDNVARTLKPGGHILVRDYAAGDLAQERLSSKEQKISDHFFVRGDGTRAYYFSEAALRGLLEGAGFACEGLKLHCRDVENRARGIVMHRRWIQGAFRLLAPAVVAPAGGGGACPSGDREPANGDATAASTPGEARMEASLPQAAVAAAGVVYTAEAIGRRPHKPGGGGEHAAGAPTPGAAAEGACHGPAQSAVAGYGVEEAVPAADVAAAPGGGCERPRSDAGDAYECASPAGLFDLPLEYEVGTVAVGGLEVKYEALPREQQHTQPSTGLLLWEGGAALGALLARAPSLAASKAVLELGCGATAVASLLAAAAGAARVLATDGDPATLALLARNLRRNGGVGGGGGGVESRQLAWGDRVAERAAAARSPGGRGFGLILGSDVVYSRAAVPLLFQTASRLLAAPGGRRTESSPGGSHGDRAGGGATDRCANGAAAQAAGIDSRGSPSWVPGVVLCHTTRGVSEEAIVAAARAAGFRQVAAAALAAEPTDRAALQDAGAFVAKFGPLRLLCFAAAEGAPPACSSPEGSKRRPCSVLNFDPT